MAFIVHAGASEHYQRAHAYHERYLARTEDRDFYLRRARSAEAVLEYGAGTGRLTIPLAAAGKRVTAVDVSAPMVAELRRRLLQEPRAVRERVTSVVVDMRAFETRQRFDLVMVGFHGLGHLYSHEDVATFLRLAWTHLRPGGQLAFDLPMPHLDATDYDSVAQVSITEMERGSELLTLRLFHPQEIRMHLAYAGFREVRVHGDFQEHAVQGESELLVVSARRPRGC